MPSPGQIDVNVPRFNQTMVAVLTGLAFVAQLPWLVAFVSAVLAAGYVFGPRFGLFIQIYVRFLQPAVDPTPEEFEDAEPPRFAQLLGAIVLGAASVAFALSWPVLGWVLTLTVTALATLAATTRVCVGCFIYRQTQTRP